MAPRRFTVPPSAIAPPAVTRSRKRAASKPLSKPRGTRLILSQPGPPRPPGVPETPAYDRTTLAAAAAAVIVTPSPPPPSSSPPPFPPSGRSRLSISPDGPETQEFFRSVRAPHDETQAPGVVHPWNQLHSKTVIEVDPNTDSDSEAPSPVSSL